MKRLRLALGRLLADLALRLMEPRPGEPFDRERSRQIDEIMTRLAGQK